MYGKSYESKYEGSMVGAGIAVFAVWDYMLTKAREGYVEVNPKLLAFTLGGPQQDPQVIEDALEFLQSPDPDSRSKKEEGRRIVKEGEFQYRLVNWAEYNRIRTEADRREYNRVKQSEHRARKKVPKPSEREGRYVKAVEAGDEKRADAIAAEGLNHNPPLPDGWEPAV